ncbi:MAG: hypothetical protein NT028_09825 [candidate division Zixibacteria bacterium]|nr:hypothetical protein [candidate division Zixibacteria bacterium]
MSGTVALMLSQPESRINFREIMDTGKILLIDLAELGSDVRELLGSFILSLLHIAALSRSDTAIEQRKPFHIFCDEAHRFLNASCEDLIAENRKFAVSLTLAHQYLEQFNKATRDAIDTDNIGITGILTQLGEAMKQQLIRLIEWHATNLIDPTDWQLQKQIVTHLIKLFGDSLPEVIRNSDPSRFTKAVGSVLRSETGVPSHPLESL